MQYYSLINSVFSIFVLLLIIYISQYSKISKEKEYRIPFWTIIVLSFVCLRLIGWEFPVLRIVLLGLTLVVIFSIYYLHFRQRTKTSLDYLKLAWLLFFIFDNFTINSMRYIYTTDKSNCLINNDVTNLLDLIFDFIHVVLLSIIAFKIYITQKKVE